MAKYIKLSGKAGRGKLAVVDDEDFERANQLRWHFDGRYAARKSKKEGKMYLHMFILGKKERLIIDHENRDKLDCRRENMRFVTYSTNLFNKGLNKSNTTGHKGVYWHKMAKKWMATITINYRQIYLGLFNELDKAIAVRREWEGKYKIWYDE